MPASTSPDQWLAVDGGLSVVIGRASGSGPYGTRRKPLWQTGHLDTTCSDCAGLSVPSDVAQQRVETRLVHLGYASRARLSPHRPTQPTTDRAGTAAIRPYQRQQGVGPPSCMVGLFRVPVLVKGWSWAGRSGTSRCAEKPPTTSARPVQIWQLRCCLEQGRHSAAGQPLDGCISSEARRGAVHVVVRSRWPRMPAWPG